MEEYGFSLNRIIQYKGRIVYSVLTQENMGQRKLVFSHILCIILFERFLFYYQKQSPEAVL